MTTRQSDERRSNAATAAVVAAASAAMIFGATAAHAQGAPPAPEAQVLAQAVDQLPPVIVQGATLAPPKPERKPTAAEPADSGSAPAATKPIKSSGAAANQGAPGGGPADVPSVATGGGDGGTAYASDGVPADRLGTSVSVVTGDQIRAQQVQNAAEALRSMPGVTVSRSGSRAGLTEVRIRGAEGNHTLVLIDGVEVNNPVAGGFDFSDLLADDIERIEIIRGPQSGLFGSNALGGVVNVITRSGRGPLTLAIAAEGGSFQTRGVAARASAGNENAWFSVSNQFQRSDGFNVAPVGNEDDPFRINQFSLRAGARLLPGLTVDFSVRNVRKNAARDAFDGAVGTLATAFDDGSKYQTNFWVTGGQLRWDMLDGRMTHLFKASRVTNTLIDDDVTSAFRSENRAEAEKLSYVLAYRFATGPVRHTVSGLIESDSQTFLPFGVEKSRKQIATAAEYQADIAERVLVTGNVRRDDNDTFVDFTTWRATAALRLPELGMRPHASIGTGVRLPTMFEQFGFFGTFVPNPNAQPEESLGWDAGVEFTVLAGRAVVDVTYFEAELKNKITENATFTSIINLPGISRRDGVEVAGRFAVSPVLTLGASYTFLHAVTPDGGLEIRRPEHAARFDVDYRFDGGRGRLNIAAIYNGEMADRGLRVTGRAGPFPFFAAEPLTLDDYWLVSVAASYKVLPGVELFGRVENALDWKYEEQEGYNTAGLAAYAGVRLTYEEPATLHWADRR